MTGNAIEFKLGFDTSGMRSGAARAQGIAHRAMARIGAGSAAAFGVIAAASAQAFNTVANAARGAASGIKGAFDLGGTLSDLSAQTGIAVRDLYLLQKAFESNGGTAEDATKSINKMQRVIAEAAAGSSTGIDALEAVGLKLADLQGLSPYDQFKKIARGISEIADPTMRVGAAMDIFGRSGAKLLTLFADKGALATAERVFGPMAELLGANAAKFDEVSDKMARVGLKLQSFHLGAAEAMSDTLMPILERMEGADFIEKGKAFGERVAEAAKWISGAMEDASAMAGSAGRIMDHLRGLFATVMGMAAGAGNYLWDGAKRFYDILKTAFLVAASGAMTLGADLLELPMALALDMETGLEWAFQKAIEFFDKGLRPVIESIKAAILWAVEQAKEAIGKIPMLGKRAGLQGFRARSFEQIQDSVRSSDKPFEAQGYAEIRDRNYRNSAAMQKGMAAVGDMRRSAEDLARQASGAWDAAMSKNAPVFDHAAWFDNAAFYKTRAMAGPEAPAAPVREVPRRKRDPFEGFKNASRTSSLGGPVGFDPETGQTRPLSGMNERLTGGGMIEKIGGDLSKAQGHHRRGQAAKEREEIARRRDEAKAKETAGDKRLEHLEKLDDIAEGVDRMVEVWEK